MDYWTHCFSVTRFQPIHSTVYTRHMERAASIFFSTYKPMYISLKKKYCYYVMCWYRWGWKVLFFMYPPLKYHVPLGHRWSRLSTSSFNIYGLSWLLGKDNGVVSYYFLCDFEFILLSLTLSPKTGPAIYLKVGFSCYLPQN